MNISDEFGDWRILGALRLAEDVPAAFPGGPSHKAGSPVLLTDLACDESGVPTGFTAPDASAMAFSIAYRASNEATKLKNKLRFDQVATPDGPGQAVSNDNSTELFDFFEAAMQSVVFSFLALECFCNHVINRELTEAVEIKRKKKRIFLSPAQAERQLSTEEKLTQIIPKLKGKATPKGKKVWESFVNLKRARDSCVHMKGSSQYSGGDSDDNSLFFFFLHFNISEYPDASRRMVEYFFQSERLPRWLVLLNSTLEKEKKIERGTRGQSPYFKEPDHRSVL